MLAIGFAWFCLTFRQEVVLDWKMFAICPRSQFKAPKSLKSGPWCTTTDNAQFSEACQHQQEFPGGTLKWLVVSLGLGCDRIKKIDFLGLTALACGLLVVVFLTSFVHVGGIDILFPRKFQDFLPLSGGN